MERRAVRSGEFSTAPREAVAPALFGSESFFIFIVLFFLPMPWKLFCERVLLCWLTCEAERWWALLAGIVCL